MNRLDLSLYVVTDRGLSLGRGIDYVVAKAVEGGATIVQLREKDCPGLMFYRLALRLKEVLRGTGVPLIINDRIDIAMAADADGVHIGQGDIPYPEARRLLGPGKIIGLSIENRQQLEEASAFSGLDYIAYSPVFSTATKADTASALELDGVGALSKASRFPSVAIGGINKGNAGSVIKAGAGGIAVVSAISQAPDPAAAARELLQIVKSARR